MNPNESKTLWNPSYHKICKSVVPQPDPPPPLLPLGMCIITIGPNNRKTHWNTKCNQIFISAPPLPLILRDFRGALEMLICTF